MTTDQTLVLVGDEHALPYERPPLSKAVLRGETDQETTRVYDDLDIVGGKCNLQPHGCRFS